MADTSTAPRLAAQPKLLGTSPADLYRRAQASLASYGHVPGVDLSDGASRLLLFLLAQGPGYMAKRRTLASRLCTNQRSISARLAELRCAVVGGVPLLSTGIKVPLHGRRPWAPRSVGTRANLHGYDLAAPELLEALDQARARDRAAREAVEAEHDAAALERAQRRRARREPATTSGQKPASILNDPIFASPPLSTLPFSLGPDASLPKPEGGKKVASETPSSVARCNEAPRASQQTPRAGDREQRREKVHESGQASAEPASLETEREIRAICDEWNGLGLRNRDGTPSVAGKVEARTLRARLKGGRSLDELHAVVAGAALFDEAWLSKGRALCAFAVAFCEKRGAFDRAAHEGRKRMTLGAPRDERQTREEQEEQWGRQRADKLREHLDLEQRLRSAGLTEDAPTPRKRE